MEANPAAVEDLPSTLSTKLGRSAALVVAGVCIAVGGSFAGATPTSYLGLFLLLPIGAALAARHPVATAGALVFLTGFSGSIIVYTAYTARPAIEFILLSLWAGLAFSLLRGRKARIWLWPGVLVLGFYIALTLVEALTTDPIATGWQSFRLATAAMATVLLVGLSPWARKHNRQIGQVILLLALAVGAFAAFKYIVGPTATETSLARLSLPGVPTSIPVRFFGSQATAQQLALWCATTLPAVLALTLAWQGRWRAVGALAAALLAFALIATEVRTGAIAGSVGILITLLLFQLARAFPARTRIPVGLTATVAILVTVVGGFVLSVGQSDERVDRFLQVLSPTEDDAYATRAERWGEAWPVVTDEPLGHGLGTSGTLATRDDFVPLTATNLDSSYLKIGIEQGPLVMGLFIFALAILGLTLAQRSISTRDQTRAALGIAACGSLSAIAVMFYAGFYIEQLQIVVAWLIVGLGIAQFAVLSDSSPGQKEVAAIGHPPAGPEARIGRSAISSRSSTRRSRDHFAGPR